MHYSKTCGTALHETTISYCLLSVSGSFIRTYVFHFAIIPVVLVVVVAPGVFRVVRVATIILCFSSTSIGEVVFAILLRPWYTRADRWFVCGIMCRVCQFSHVVPPSRIVVVIVNVCNKNSQ